MAPKKKRKVTKAEVAKKVKDEEDSSSSSSSSSDSDSSESESEGMKAFIARSPASEAGSGSEPSSDVDEEASGDAVVREEAQGPRLRKVGAKVEKEERPEEQLPIAASDAEEDDEDDLDKPVAGGVMLSAEQLQDVEDIFGDRDVLDRMTIWGAQVEKETLGDVADKGDKVNELFEPADIKALHYGVDVDEGWPEALFDRYFKNSRLDGEIERQRWEVAAVQKEVALEFEFMEVRMLADEAEYIQAMVTRMAGKTHFTSGAKAPKWSAVRTDETGTQFPADSFLRGIDVPSAFAPVRKNVKQKEGGLFHTLNTDERPRDMEQLGPEEQQLLKKSITAARELVKRRIQAVLQCFRIFKLEPNTVIHLHSYAYAPELNADTVWKLWELDEIWEATYRKYLRVQDRIKQLAMDERLHERVSPGDRKAILDLWNDGNYDDDFRTFWDKEDAPLVVQDYADYIACLFPMDTDDIDEVFGFSGPSVSSGNYSLIRESRLDVNIGEAAFFEVP
mmetsp:Transcript_27862/g.63389  ORF Transcript_27862/g.63389 Transcript_27862/m.63389 type:complete len:506 (+) Transcript_27862:41-1558(+)